MHRSILPRSSLSLSDVFRLVSTSAIPLPFGPFNCKLDSSFRRRRVSRDNCYLHGIKRNAKRGLRVIVLHARIERFLCHVAPVSVGRAIATENYIKFSFPRIHPRGEMNAKFLCRAAEAVEREPPPAATERAPRVR